ncbi:MAG: response regulator [Bacteroidales bacterium]|nr:response regulator [Bacteroidales bacterium]
MNQTEKPKCLVVDDDVTFQVYLKVLLEKNGFEVKKTSGAEEAIQSLHKNNFDLIISDIEMPGMDGIEFISAIKSNSKLSKIPVIFITNVSDNKIISKAFNLGVNGLIRKPFLSLYINRLYELLTTRKDDPVWSDINHYY